MNLSIIPEGVEDAIPHRPFKNTPSQYRDTGRYRASASERGRCQREKPLYILCEYIDRFRNTYISVYNEICKCHQINILLRATELILIIITII